MDPIRIVGTAAPKFPGPTELESARSTGPVPWWTRSPHGRRRGSHRAKPGRSRHVGCEDQCPARRARHPAQLSDLRGEHPRQPIAAPAAGLDRPDPLPARTSTASPCASPAKASTHPNASAAIAGSLKLPILAAQYPPPRPPLRPQGRTLPRDGSSPPSRALSGNCLLRFLRRSEEKIRVPCRALGRTAPRRIRGSHLAQIGASRKIMRGGTSHAKHRQQGRSSEQWPRTLNDTGKTRRPNGEHNMSDSQPELPNQIDQDYHSHGSTGTTDAATPGEIQVIVPPAPPAFGPAAARALLRLLVEVHRERSDAAEDPMEET